MLKTSPNANIPMRNDTVMDPISLIEVYNTIFGTEVEWKRHIIQTVT